MLEISFFGQKFPKKEISDGLHNRFWEAEF
jgi:hypothetical protein